MKRKHMGDVFMLVQGQNRNYWFGNPLFKITFK